MGNGTWPCEAYRSLGSTHRRCHLVYTKEVEELNFLWCNARDGQGFSATGALCMWILDDAKQYGGGNPG